MSDKLKNVTILVVEGPGNYQGVTGALLEELGARDIVVTDSGRQALADERTRHCNLVFCYWQTGDLDGLSVLHALRADPATASVNFVLTDETTSPERLDAAAEAGVNNYIAHPFDAATLMRKIEVLLGRFR